MLALLAAATAGGVDARPFEKIKGRECFRSMRGMRDSMRYLSEDYPNLVTITNIGESWLKNNKGRHDGVHEIPDGGYDIYALNITASDSTLLSEEKGKMLITSGVHAREWAPPELLGRFIETLVHGYNHEADITTILERTEVHAILYVNPDGRFMAEKYPHLLWRKNLNPVRCGGGEEYGVDINRNFDFFWGDQNGASNYPCAGDYHGPRPASEPETIALVNYAMELFPENQRRANPEAGIHQEFGEDISDMYIDIHAYGGYVYYPWGHKDAKSEDDDALQALGRKINSFNGYKLWAGSQPDFVYPASGDTSDYMYAKHGVASLGFEIGDAFDQDCDGFEKDVVPKNLPALLFAAKNVKKPFSTIKGPDLFDVDVHHVNGELRISAHASDSKMVNAISAGEVFFDDFSTGYQDVTSVKLYLDRHPEDYQVGDTMWEMEPVDHGMDSSEETVGKIVKATALSPGKHIIYAQAMDSDGYKGPVSSLYVDISEMEVSLRGQSLRGSRTP